MDDYVAPFIIGHHDSKRSAPVTPDVVTNAHAAGYDMVTSPITTPHFQSRVLSLLSGFLSDPATSSSADITQSLDASPVRIPPLEPSDNPLTPNDSLHQVIAYASSWTDLCSPDPVIADVSRQVLRLELEYAAFCGIGYVLIPGPRLRGQGASSSNVVQYGRAILEALNIGVYMQLFVWLPMIDHDENESQEMGDLAPFARSQFLEASNEEPLPLDLFGTWEAWDAIRAICKYSTRLSVALSMPRLLPPTSIQSRWFSEPVKLLTIERGVFAKNPKGYPALSKAHQALVTRFVRFKQPAVWFLLADVGPIPSQVKRATDPGDPSAFPTLAESASSTYVRDPTPHLSYLRNLQNKQPPKTLVDNFGAGYHDYLQAPLQPLTVNLESITYEVFEKDPIKYEWYERAIARALHDWIEQGKPTSNPDGRVVVAVVGAGRGPLVTRALQASEAVGVEIDMWALEKNQNAFVLLQRHNETLWSNRVNLVRSDMRTWRGPVRSANATQIRKSFNLDPNQAAAVGEAESEQQLQSRTLDGRGETFTGSVESDQNYLLATATHADTNYKIDILISELLGSFADNELSPECLDGVQHLLNPTHGISIPASYTAHVTPVSAPKLHADISLTMTNTVSHAAEIPYVVMLNAIDFLSTSSLPSPSPTASWAPAKGTPLHSNPTKRQSYSAAAATGTSSSEIAKTVNNPAATAPSESSTPPQSPDESLPNIRMAWSFQHPNPSAMKSFTTFSTTATAAPSNAHNARHCTLSFPVTHRGTCHGLAGYFETVLYPGVELSTNPLTMDRKSEGMISWFPIYFPLKTPLLVPDNSTMTVQMWRKTDDRKVWYEWIVDVYQTVTHIYPDYDPAAGHDGVRLQQGQRQPQPHPQPERKGQRQRPKQRRVGGSALHSSEKEACLM